MKKKIKIIDILCYISIGEYDKLPKKVGYDEIEWKLDTNNYCKADYTDGNQYMFADYIDKHYIIQEILNDDIEILDEEDEFEDIERLPINELYLTESQQSSIVDTINGLIKNQKKIIERLNNQDNN